MTLQQRLDAAHARSVKLYLQRQEAEQEAQRLQMMRVQIDQALLKLDGEIDSLTAQIAEGVADGQ